MYFLSVGDKNSAQLTTKSKFNLIFNLFNRLAKFIKLKRGPQAA